MLPPFYQAHLQQCLSPRHYLLVNLLVLLLQWHKQVRLERLAANLPLPIQFEGRRRCLQRLFSSPQLSIDRLWLPLVSCLLSHCFREGKTLYLALDRTQWQGVNVLMVSVIYRGRALPLYWQFLSHSGSSGLAQQQAVLRPILARLKPYQVVVLGDREFCSVHLAQWLRQEQLSFCLRLRCNEYVQDSDGSAQQLQDLELKPGQSQFFQQVKVTKQASLGLFNVACYWKRAYRGHCEKSAWFLLTNLPSLGAAVQAYQQRMGIEAFFRDYKSGGYQVESTRLNPQRLSGLFVLLALAYTSAVIQGHEVRTQGLASYICRTQERRRMRRRHSDFWIGLYAQAWLGGMDLATSWLESWMQLSGNKRMYLQQGLGAAFRLQALF
jgi:hypothetical protein